MQKQKADRREQKIGVPGGHVVGGHVTNHVFKYSLTAQL